MREIKFRAWDKFNKEMYAIAGVGLLGTGFPATNNTNETSHFIAADYCELMQYTGLKDKNGVEIYEGDIVKSYNITDEDNSPAICTVVWNRNFYATERIGGGGSTGLYFSDGEFGVEIIGNIYENPDLLKDK